MKTLFLFFAICMIGCKNIEYSPNQVFDKNSYKDLNNKNIKKLNDLPQDDTIRFVITGDTQRWYDEAQKFYKKVNSMSGVDFVIIAGDITEFGTLKEMQWAAREFNKLSIPYLTIIGNHDLTMRGQDVFHRMYGDLNFSFIYGDTKFICHDTNSREYQFNGKVPNIPWLKKELLTEEGINNFVAISHVPPNSNDFDKNLVKEYVNIFDKTDGFLASFHGHDHNFDSFRLEDSQVPFVITGAIGKHEFLLVEIINNKIHVERIYF